MMDSVGSYKKVPDRIRIVSVRVTFKQDVLLDSIYEIVLAHSFSRTSFWHLYCCEETVSDKNWMIWSGAKVVTTGQTHRISLNTRSLILRIAKLLSGS